MNIKYPTSAPARGVHLRAFNAGTVVRATNNPAIENKRYLIVALAHFPIRGGVHRFSAVDLTTGVAHQFDERIFNDTCFTQELGSYVVPGEAGK